MREPIPKYWQDVVDATDINTWFKAINKALNIQKRYKIIQHRRATDEEYRQKLCAYEKKKNIKRTQNGLRKAESAKRRAAELNAMPAWADKEKIDAIYKEASILNLGLSKDSDEYYHVDHIIPLVAKNKHNGEHIACGLHVHTNLQIILAKENLKKGCVMPE